MTTILAAPFPYFGGKRRAAPLIWSALGDPGGYVEPFAGSAAVLLARPPFKGRRVETLNDADGWLVNAWRSIKLSPDEVAAYAAGPLTEIDYHARLAWLQARRGAGLVAWLEGDPEAHDAKAAAWWLYVMSAGFGNPFQPGPWHVVDGRLVEQETTGSGVCRRIPSVGDGGRGIFAARSADLADYMAALADRLARVRITCGDWRRVVTHTVLNPRTGGEGVTGVLLDPPYGADLRDGDGPLYAHESLSVAEDVREWCLTAPPDLRIVLCGRDNEHDQLIAHGWRKIDGKAGSGAGYATRRDNGRRERLWLSPACIRAGQGELW